MNLPIRTASSVSRETGRPRTVRPDVNDVLKGVYRDPQFGAIPDPIRSRNGGSNRDAGQSNPFSAAGGINGVLGNAAVPSHANPRSTFSGNLRGAAEDSSGGAIINRSTRRFFSGSVSRYRNLSQFSMTSSGRRQYVQTRTAEADALLERRLKMIRQMRQDAADIGDADALKEADRLESLAREQYTQRTTSMKSAEAAIDAIMPDAPAETPPAEMRPVSDSSIE